MLQGLQVNGTNAINRYGFRFTAGALLDALWKTYDLGVPTYIAHDRSRLLGWATPLAVHFEPGMVRSLHIQNIGETSDDFETLRNLADVFYAKMYSERHESISQLRELIRSNLQGNEKVIHIPTIAFVEPDLATRVFPEIFRRADTDKDGLFPLQDLTPIGEGVYQVGELVLFAHPYFRRSFLRINTLNSPFLKHFQSLESGLLPKVALDRDAVGLASSYGEPMELAYWWGPKFSDDLSSIAPGVTVHGSTDEERFYFGVRQTEFWWQSRKGEHIFEAEELPERPIPLDFEETPEYGCRYVHSIISEATNEVIHLDGAVRQYSEEQMHERREILINRAGRHTKYVKLWRVDGHLPVTVWKSLVSDYYRDNLLVGEYLGGQEENPLRLVEDSQDEISETDYVPYSMDKRMGMRVSLSIHPPTPKPEVSATHIFIPLDYAVYSEETFLVMETEAIELQKVLVRSGASVHVANNTRNVKFYDHYTNFPLVFHAGEGIDTSLRKTIESLKLLLAEWKNRNIDQVIAYTLGFPIDDKEIRISIMGHINDILDWLALPLCYPPTSKEAIESWAENVSDFLDAQYPTASERPRLHSILMESGLLSIQRVSLSNEQYELVFDDKIGILTKVISSELETSLQAKIKANELVPAIALNIKASKCSKCGLAYKDCDCSKLLDDDVFQEITEAAPLLVFWTDRPVYQGSPNIRNPTLHDVD